MISAPQPFLLLSAATAIASLTTRRMPMAFAHVLTFIYYKLRSTEKRTNFWLRDVSTSNYFACVYGVGICLSINASFTDGVRPCFNLYQVLITVSCNRVYYWLRDVCTSDTFADIRSQGLCNLHNATYSGGVRPCFNLYMM